MAADGSGPLAKRTSELRQSESPFASLTPPQLNLPNPNLSSDSSIPLLATVAEHSSIPPSSSSSSSSPPSSSSTFFSGRPRAGTLPSTFHLSPSPSSVARNQLNLGSLLAPPSLSTSASGSASLPGSGPTTPLDLPFPSALIPPSSSSHSRLRSGSLTALRPTTNLSSAFAFGPGPSVFSSGDWTPRPAGPATATSRAAMADSKAAEDSRSPEGSAYGDEHVRTLDYLGLVDETPSNGSGAYGSVGEGSSGMGMSEANSSGTSLAPTAPTMHRLGSTGSMRSSTGPLADITAQHSRLRSNTVAAFPRSSPTESLLRHFHQASSSASYPSAAVGTRPLEEDSNSSYRHRPSSSTDSGRLLYATAVSLSDDHQPPPHQAPPLVSIRPPTDAVDSPARARAATIGILDDSREMLPRRRAGTTVGVGPSGLGLGGASGAAAVAAQGEYSGGTASVLGRALGRMSINEDPQPGAVSGAGPSGQGWHDPSRPRTPERVSLSPPHQQPTRSLWVGNLDPKTTPADLQQVFAPYGAIESLRLIPEKECGFVNFVSVADAMRAKEDVLNRLGGQLTKTSGLVRIGYGKAEATPAPTAPGLIHPRSTAAGAAVLTGADLNLQTQPTRALWIGSIPATTTPNHLLAIFSSFGPIESARVLTHKSCGFVNFERLDDAVAARKSLNGREILGAEVGPVRIGYAKVPTKVLDGPFNPAVPTPNGLGTYPAVFGAISQLDGVSGIPVERQLADGQLQDYRSNLVVGLVSNGHYASAHALHPQSALFAPGAMLPPAPHEPLIETIVGSVNEVQLLMRELSQDDPEMEEHIAAVAVTRPPSTYYTSIPLHVMNDPRFARRYSNADAPRLREIRKRLDSEPTVEQVDDVAHELLDEIVPLASDYIGNTIVQKLFEQASRPARMTMLERIAPHLAPIGTHKNGTWAVQKIIQCVQDEDEFAIIEQNLQPYTPPLLLNDFGNYVVQGTLRFGSPHSNFLFDGMVDRIWEIGSGRFGARSTRQTLENPQSPRLHVKRVAIAIILNAIPLATSSNGALLITWFLESSGLPGRYGLLAPRFAPHLSHLCTHKLASQSVMRIINQREDFEAQRMMLDALFDPETKVLEDILGDQIHGTACISKFMSSTFFSEARRDEMVERIKQAIDSLRVQAVPAYRKLMEEVGMAYSGPPGAPTPPFAPSPLNSEYRQSSSPHSGSPPYDHRSPAQSYQQLSQFGPSPRDRRGVPNQRQYPPSSPSQYPAMPPPQFGLSPYSAMAYPPPFSQSGPYGYPSPYGAPPLSAFPYGTPGSPGQRDQAGSSGLSPLVQHASLPPNAPLSPFSPGAYPPAIGSPDPFATLRVNTGEANVGFNPAWSPLSSPPPGFPFGATFGAAMDGSGGFNATGHQNGSS
ncbi:hypothetical protein JCM21900_004990 [Sporobolomyces salmonicolor]